MKWCLACYLVLGVEMVMSKWNDYATNISVKNLSTMSGIISCTPSPISSTASHLIYCRCGMLRIGKTGRSLKTRSGEIDGQSLAVML
jgi:hypothetical protein